jgi:diguanylate cyclase (GGDEF)-like protein
VLRKRVIRRGGTISHFERVRPSGILCVRFFSGSFGVFNGKRKGAPGNLGPRQGATKRMTADVTKNLDRARRYLERNKLKEAISEYQSVLDAIPGHAEAIQMLADVHVRAGEPQRAAPYYGMQFDKLVESGDLSRATAIYTHHLKPFAQPSARLVRFGFLLQKHNKPVEAIEAFSLAAQQYHHQNDSAAELDCLQRIAQLDPENPERQVDLAELAERLDDAEIAGRGYLRAAQLTQATGHADRALELFASSHRLMADDRSVALLYADARLRHGEAAAAVELLQPFTPPDPADAAFLEIYGEALLRTGQLDAACEMLLALYRQKPDGYELLFELADAYLQAGEDDKAVAVLDQTKDWMVAARAEMVFAARVDQLAESHQKSFGLASFCASLYDQLNREVRYFDALVRAFDLAVETGKIDAACEAIDRLVEIDPYDYRIRERITRLEGKATPDFVRSISARAAKVVGVPSETATGLGGGIPGESARAPATEEEKAQRALDDLIVQAEIFLQYSLQAKAAERLERIAEMFPGEEDRNERLHLLYERANWWPKGVRPKQPAAPIAPASPPPVAAPVSPPVSAPADTHRDLAEIAEITRLMYREVTPREVLGMAVREIGKYLNVRRCLAIIGRPGDAPQMTAEFAAPGLKQASTTLAAKAAAELLKISPDANGGISARSAAVAELRSLGVETALGVLLTDKDTQEPSGVLFVADTASRHWKPNETFFLLAVGDQVMISVNHTRLRSLVRTLAVADEKTGLLGRGAYTDCLLAESKRSRTQGAPLALVLLQLDHGGELLRQEGDAAMEAYMNQVARALESCIRQGDLGVKYTAWCLAFVLPDTTREKAEAFAVKMLQTASRVKPSWAKKAVTLSAVVADASSRPGDEHEDRVTEWINRAEFGLDEARHRGGDTIVSLAPPQIS